MSSKYRIIPLGGGGGITPTGTLDIRSEGVFDVTDYASVDVDIFDDTTTKTITNNGTYNASDDHVLGYSQVTVQVPASAVDTGTKSDTITINGTSTIDVVGYASHEVTVAVPASAVDSGTKQITSNGNGQDVVGYAAVDVNVPNGTETITITQNGVYYPTSPNVGFSEVVVNVGGSNPDYFWVKSREAGQEVGFYRTSSSISWPNIEYSFDKTNWTTLQGGSSVVIPNSGQKLYMRGYNPLGLNKEFSEMVYPEMHMQLSVHGQNSDEYDVGGNMMTLLYKEADVRVAPTYAFLGFFYMASLIDASELTLGAEVVGTRAFQSTFSSSSITKAPNIPCTTVDRYSFNSTFSNCTSLTQLPSTLPALTTSYYGYNEMFSNCTSLTSIPSGFLPATNLSRCCYFRMFSGCTSLMSVPVGLLPATTLSERCYSGMFDGCSLLGNSPYLQATTLDFYCYHRMLAGTAITSITLPATTLFERCYDEMFDGCSSLNNISIQYAGNDWMNTDNPNCTWAKYSSNWTNGVSATGIFENLGHAVIPTNDPSHTCDGDPDPFYGGIPQGWTVQTVDYFYIQNEDTQDLTFTLKTPNYDYQSTDLAWSKDMSTWTQFTKGVSQTQTVPLLQGEKLYLRSSTGFAKYYHTFSPITISCDGLFSAHGDLRTLIDYTNVSSVTSLPAGAFYRMFHDTGNLTEIDCTLNGVTTIGAISFGEFAARVSSGDTNLTRVRIWMPDVTSVNGSTQGHAGTMASFYDAFYFRSALQEITVPKLQTWDNTAFVGWMYGVNSTGTAYVPTGVTIPSNANGIPANWTRVNY